MVAIIGVTVCSLQGRGMLKAISTQNTHERFFYEIKFFRVSFLLCFKSKKDDDLLVLSFWRSKYQE